MNNDVLKNIRKNNIKRIFAYIIPVAIVDIIVISMIYGLITNGFEIYLLIMTVFMGIFAFFINGVLLDCIELAINPLKDNVFKKYGSPEKISEILKEIENTKEYEDKNIIISKNYICDKKDYNKIVAFNNAIIHFFDLLSFLRHTFCNFLAVCSFFQHGILTNNYFLHPVLRVD